MSFRSRIALGGLLALAAAGPGHASVVAGPLISSYTVGIDTGVQSWIADFNSDGVTLNNSPSYNVPLFNPAYGVYQGTVSVVTLTGYPFIANYTVQGATGAIGDQVIAHETLSGEVEMLVNNVVSQTATFSLSLSPSCTAIANGFTVIDCSAQQTQTFFSEPIPVVLPAGAMVSFSEKLTETDVSCVVDFVAGGSSACISGNSSITDMSNNNDPQYEGNLSVTYDYVPEPATMSIMVLGLAGLAAARRGRRARTTTDR